METESKENPFESVKSRLQKRDEERLRDLENRKKEKEETAAETEQMSYFTEMFMEKRQEIEEALNKAKSGSIDKSLLPDHFYNVNKDILTLQQFVASSKLFIRGYDIRRANETIQTLQQSLKDLEEFLLPKKKFAFKSRGFLVKKNFDSLKKSEDSVDSVKITETSKDKLGYNYEENTLGFSNRVGEVLSLTADELCKQDVMLSHLENCTVRLAGASATVHMISLSNCTVLCGPVSSSIFVDSCSDSTFVLASQQVRIHTSERCDFYLHVTSKAIIEDCTDLRFAPFNWDYEGLEKQYEIAGLNRDWNNWNLVDDFNWLVRGTQSPNWKILDENDRKSNWN